MCMCGFVRAWMRACVTVRARVRVCVCVRARMCGYVDTCVRAGECLRAGVYTGEREL